ncbi:MAG: 4'-phosphopantetheinyl transferase superfamily protein [Oscillospiraceae bacterium]|nr:4'-phosphopantetheinyl transferase superfamily protein [Oscillospiraceae bacterium]
MRIAFARLNGRDGHTVGRELLQQLCGGEMPEIAVTELGKPYFADNKLHFSISHTKRHAFCCLSAHNVGLDAEEMDRRVSPALSGKILSPTEQRRHAAAADPNAAILRLWVLKEAYAKLTGKGLGDYLYQTDFDPDDPRIMIIDGCYVAVMEEKENAV